MQTELFYESIDDAYRAGVDHCGGAKKVGAMLWPEKSPDEAGRMLRACINSDRAEKFSEEQRVFLLRLFRENGFHGLMNYLADQAMYERPRTVEPEDEAAAIQRAMDVTVDRMSTLMKRYERLRTSADPSYVRTLRS